MKRRETRDADDRRTRSFEIAPSKLSSPYKLETTGDCEGADRAVFYKPKCGFCPLIFQISSSDTT